MFLPELRQCRRFELQRDHAVTAMRREILDRCGVGLTEHAFHGGVDHGQRRSHDGGDTVAS